MPLEPGEQTEQHFGTVFEWTKLPLTCRFLAMHLMTQAKNNISAPELNRHPGVRRRAGGVRAVASAPAAPREKVHSILLIHVH